MQAFTTNEAKLRCAWLEEISRETIEQSLS